jgi:choline dehydrogenase-like flavoprotein
VPLPPVPLGKLGTTLAKGMGTARMGTDPRTSVVNSWGRCHDVRNLFIVDGSIFVTAAAVNPTNTIQALALYIADTMKKNLANLFDDDR